MLGLSTGVLWGIAAGSAVFVGTLGAVLFLLYYGGSFDRMKKEAAGTPTTMGEIKPLLYDELLQKAEKLPLKPTLGVSLDGKFVRIIPFKFQDVGEELFNISNGSAR
jgi:hypothetical protein